MLFKIFHLVPFIRISSPASHTSPINDTSIEQLFNTNFAKVNKQSSTKLSFRQYDLSNSNLRDNSILTYIILKIITKCLKANEFLI